MQLLVLGKFLEIVDGRNLEQPRLYIMAVWLFSDRLLEEMDGL